MAFVADLTNHDWQEIYVRYINDTSDLCSDKVLHYITNIVP